MVDELHGGLGEEVDGKGIAEGHTQVTQNLHETSVYKYRYGFTNFKCNESIKRIQYPASTSI
jgi:hypothetical protein